MIPQPSTGPWPSTVKPWKRLALSVCPGWSWRVRVSASSGPLSPRCRRARLRSRCGSPSLGCSHSPISSSSNAHGPNEVHASNPQRVNLRARHKVVDAARQVEDVEREQVKAQELGLDLDHVAAVLAAATRVTEHAFPESARVHGDGDVAPAGQRRGAIV